MAAYNTIDIKKNCRVFSKFEPSADNAAVFYYDRPQMLTDEQIMDEASRTAETLIKERGIGALKSIFIARTESQVSEYQSAHSE